MQTHRNPFVTDDDSEHGYRGHVYDHGGGDRIPLTPMSASGSPARTSFDTGVESHYMYSRSGEGGNSPRPRARNVSMMMRRRGEPDPFGDANDMEMGMR
jgi:hypothetical protein